MQDDSQPQQDVTESSQEVEEDAANQFEGSHGDADDVAHQRTHVLDLPDIRNLDHRAPWHLHPHAKLGEHVQ